MALVVVPGAFALGVLSAERGATYARWSDEASTPRFTVGAGAWDDDTPADPVGARAADGDRSDQPDQPDQPDPPDPPEPPEPPRPGAVPGVVAWEACTAIGDYDVVRFGTEGDDVLVGGPQREVLLGLGGDDVIIGGGAEDCLVGGDGHDDLRGGDGDDVLLGDGGVDTCRPGPGAGSSSGCEHLDRVPDGVEVDRG
ncbi:hypothetical protein ABFT23_10465 [Nocardioides sp. C4-1]|uniref:hypothetical protein n=1 Tax=Nocardioides sp. C4-1 TaxID=3151851 RepID=UPI0032666C5E